MNLHQIELLTSEAPTLFVGRTSDDRPAEVRYRDCWLSIDIGMPGEREVSLSAYTVYEEDVLSASGNENAITWEEVQQLIAPVDLRERLDPLEKDEREHQARWSRLFEGIRRHDLPTELFWSLALDDIPWVTPSKNRVGRFDFEWAMRSHCKTGVCAYVFIDPDSRACVITVVPAGGFVGRWNWMDLALAGVNAFGGVRFGPSGGEGRGEAEGVRTGDPEEAFALVAMRLAGK